MTWKQTLLASCLFGLLGAAPAQAGPHDFVAYATRLGGDTEAATPYIAKFLAQLEADVGWTKGEAKGAFFSNRKEAQAYLDSQKPGIGLLEPALYMELRKAYALEPLVQVSSQDLYSDRLLLVVKDPALQALSDLKGKRLWTTLAESPRYLSKVVLAGRVDAAAHFKLHPIGQAMRGVRALLRGEADATLLDPGQFEAAKKLEGGAALRSVYEARGLPPLPVVFIGKFGKAEDRKKLTKALLTLCASPAGAEVCKEMRIGKLTPVDGAAFQDAQRRFDTP